MRANVPQLAAAAFIAVLVGGAACVIQQRADSIQAAGAPAAGCRVDADCASGFCDRGDCQTPSGVYGRACEPAPRMPDGLRDGKRHVCGAYLCVDGRCRSCESDQECLSELGSPRCYRLQGEPGRRCGNPSQ
jgi:hypothetical protein